MKEDEMLMCLIAFVLGYLVSRMMRGNGLMVGGQDSDEDLLGEAAAVNVDNDDNYKETYSEGPNVKQISPDESECQDRGRYKTSNKSYCNEIVLLKGNETCGDPKYRGIAGTDNLGVIEYYSPTGYCNQICGVGPNCEEE